MAEPDLGYPAHRLGSVTISPNAPIVAGSVGTWTITLTVGSVGIDEGGTIKVAQRFASDFEAPQFDRPSESGYSTVKIVPRAGGHESFTTKVRARFDRKGHDRPWMQCIVLDVYDGSLAPGDRVVVTLGDRSGGAGGSGGLRAQSFVESAHDFKVFVDPTNACLPRAVAEWPRVPIVAGEARALVLTVPTQAVVGEAVRVHLKGEDAWGNPVRHPAGTAKAQLAWEGTGAVRIDGDVAVFSTVGRGAFAATWNGLSCRSNPMTVTADAAPLKKFWGDLHAQSDATVGTGTEVEYFTFARDVAALDFCSHQGNDFQMTDEDWWRLNDVVRQFHQDGAFVVFPGYEWSGNSTAGGDRNVWYREEGQAIVRSSHWQVPHTPETDLSPADTAAELFQRLRGLRPDITLCGAHVGGRYADIRLAFDEELGPLVELVSCWGVFEWMLWDAFDKGYVVGILCNSDGHKGRPGAEGPGAGQFGIANGLTCVLARDKTRAAIWDALKNRRCYGTSGPRIDLDFEIDALPMGSARRAAGAVAAVHASATGTAPIEKLELYAGKDVVHTVRPREFDHLAGSRRVRVTWRGSRIRGRGRRVQWDGTVRAPDATIVAATPFAFDSPLDGLRSTAAHEVTFKSQTTGDADGVDLLLSDARRGRIEFDSAAGKCAVDLSELTDDAPRKTFDFGGLDMRVTIERYPERLVDRQAELRADVHPPAGRTTPYFMKVTQEDGHMAWASPIYLQRD
jgi:hypothetical protein